VIHDLSCIMFDNVVVTWIDESLENRSGVVPKPFHSWLCTLRIRTNFSAAIDCNIRYCRLIAANHCLRLGARVTGLARLAPIDLDLQLPLLAKMPWDTDARKVLNTIQQNWKNVSISTHPCLTPFRRAVHVDHCRSGCEQALDATSF
jgi:hypothetical protein